MREIYVLPGDRITSGKQREPFYFFDGLLCVSVATI